MASSTRAAARTAYHHGDLRRALLDHALALVGERGPAGWTLTEAARRAGVSHAAAYRHFTNKQDLLVALAIEAFDAFASALERARATIPADGTAEARIAAMARAYLAYARREPVRFALMFGGWVGVQTDPRLVPAGDRAFAVLAKAVEEARAAWPVATPGGGDANDDDALALRIWAWCHGVTALALAGLFDTARLAYDAGLVPEPEPLATMLDRGVQDLLAGGRP